MGYGLCIREPPKKGLSARLSRPRVAPVSPRVFCVVVLAGGWSLLLRYCAKLLLHFWVLLVPAAYNTKRCREIVGQCHVLLYKYKYPAILCHLHHPPPSVHPPLQAMPPMYRYHTMPSTTIACTTLHHLQHLTPHLIPHAIHSHPRISRRNKTAAILPHRWTTTMAVVSNPRQNMPSIHDTFHHLFLRLDWCSVRAVWMSNSWHQQFLLSTHSGLDLVPRHRLDFHRFFAGADSLHIF